GADALDGFAGVARSSHAAPMGCGVNGRLCDLGRSDLKRSSIRCGSSLHDLERPAKSDPISLDISPANGGMSGNRGGWDEGQAPEGQTRRQRTDARSDRGRPARALERTAEDGVGVALTAR